MPDTVSPVSVARTPRVLWIELTSRCPFDCVFCSRKLRRGTGEHMPFALYEDLIGGLRNPRTVVLNYSGESTLHPELLQAIARARRAGAFVELVSALALVPERMLAPLAGSGLGRLTVSFHALDGEKYREIYRYSSVEALKQRLEGFVACCRETGSAPSVDIGFVAMRQNLDQLAPVAGYASSLGIGDVLLFPVMRRDEIPVSFDAELAAPATPTESFRRELVECVERVRRQRPQMRFTICNPAFEPPGGRELGQVPRLYPWPLPEGARIHSCEQNPFETAHVLANGDVVACEVLDHVPLGNLHRQSIGAIWNGEEYLRFRERYVRGGVPECRQCIWKKAYQPAPLEPRILAARGGSAQLLHGWHDACDGGILWSTQESAAVLRPLRGSHTLHVNGILPPGAAGHPNELTVCCGGEPVGRVSNPWEENMPFGLDFEVARGGGEPWQLTFQTAEVFRPRERGVGSDQRDLGFALVLAASKREETAHPERARLLERARVWIERADRLGRRLPALSKAPVCAEPGLSIVIPERENPAELAECLAGVEAACRDLDEPAETLVVVNGTPAERYRDLIARHRQVRWIFKREPLGYLGAIRVGLARARFPWTYLLNNDAVPEGDALLRLLPLRGADVFSVGSQIFYKDPTRFREETNFTAFLLEDGLATVHDRIPESDRVREAFYSGGGASLFRTDLLRRFARDSTAYAPFYWEDVEWGWRARRLGLRVLFSPASKVHHRHRATIGKFHANEEIDAIVQRNRLLFQLRNLTAEAPTARALAEVARAEEEVASPIVAPGGLWQIARGRWWNHRAPMKEDAVAAG